MFGEQDALSSDMAHCDAPDWQDILKAARLRADSVPTGCRPARRDADQGGPLASQRVAQPEDWRRTSGAAIAESGLAVLAYRLQPVFTVVMEHLAGHPRDFAGVLCLASCSIEPHFKERVNTLFREAYAERWKSFHDYLMFQDRPAGGEDWRTLYKETLAGRLKFLLEVFERQKMPGFTMAAMSAWIRYSNGLEDQPRGYMAQYLSASVVPPEFIPCEEEHRLRFCPPSVRQQLEPGAGVTPDGVVEEEAYPYRVISGFEGLVVGKGVELQWKMQMGSPFGWWYGKLDSLHMDEDGRSAIAEITFDQFLRTARWHRLSVRIGDGVVRTCEFGGYSGGLRGVSAAEERRWMKFFPSKPLSY